MMFQPNRMNDIDNFFMRNNNQVTPKRSYSPHVVQQQQGASRSPLQYFPSNKQNQLPNRTSVSPSKQNFNRKPMIQVPNQNSNQYVMSPRNNYVQENSRGLINKSNNNRGLQGKLLKDNRHPQQLLQPNHTKGRNGSISLLGRFDQSAEVQFVMSKGVEYCGNHPNKLASFSINIQGQNMQYCSICASKLASQGFAVTSLSQSQKSQKSTKQSISKPKPLTTYKQYRGNPFYQQIMVFLKQLVNVQQNHYETMNKFSTIESHYNQQIQMTTEYYDEVIKILTEMKEEHVQDLEHEKQKYLQIADIQTQSLNSNVQVILEMRTDIQPNLQSIVKDIQQDSFRHCIYQYRQRMQILNHSLQEMDQNLKQVTSYTQGQLTQKVQLFEDAMKKLWEQQIPSQNQKFQTKNQKKQSQKEQEPVSVKNMHEMLPKGSVQQNNGQGAFRHLFEDDDNQMVSMNIPSPVFSKKI